MDKCPLLANSTVEDLGWLGKSVITVLPELPALDALKIMAANKIGAVGVEKDGRLIGNFSMTDLRCNTRFHSRRHCLFFFGILFAFLLAAVIERV
jgi:predicted transcriptional regulator